MPADQFEITWVDHQREPVNPPDPRYPDGLDVKVSAYGSGKATCTAQLPYPARRCGLYLVRCRRCGYQAAITTAGRADDPRSVTMPCKPVAAAA